jgi:hypothetical protein
MTVFALLGATALWLLYAWLLMAIIASYLSERKGYTEKPGLASGLLLHIVGVVIWLFWPAKPHSKWKMIGPVGKGKSAAARSRRSQSETASTDGEAS